MWIGLDVGTTAIKAAAYETDGRLLAMTSVDAPVQKKPGGLMEQDMNSVWELSASVLKELADKVDISKATSVGICAQGDGLWPIQKDGTPAGPAMLWNDNRADEELLRFTKSGATGTVGRGCHTSIWPGASGPLWNWIESNDPYLAAKTDKVFTCADWISYKITGQLATDYSNASIPFMDFSKREYAENSIRALECETLRSKLLKPQLATTRLGQITPEAAAQTGLPEGLPVSTGTLDHCAMIVGMGLDRDGQAMMIIGTTAVVNILTDYVEPSDVPVGASVLHPTSKAIIRVLAPTTGAAAFDWFASLHPDSLGGEDASEIAAKINSLVKVVPPGSNGVTFLPYLSGERAPFVEPNIKASFNGMTSQTTKADLGRAVMEGTGFSLRHCIVEEGGLPDGPIQLTGGGSKNPVWCQIIADIIGQPIAVSSASDQGLWGAACLGAAASGAGDAISLTKRDEEIRQFEPDKDTHQTYQRLFERYQILSDSSRESVARMREIGVE